MRKIRILDEDPLFLPIKFLTKKWNILINFFLCKLSKLKNPKCNFFNSFKVFAYLMEKAE